MRLDRKFFERDTLTVSKELLGCRLIHESSDGIAGGVIVETEAYLGLRDAAAHSYRGRNKRVAALYDQKGTAYIYMIYGLYYCFNIASGDTPEPEGILIRALEPLPPYDLMTARRKTDDLKQLCSGPGKLCIALGIDKGLYGADLCSPDGTLYIERSGPLEYEATKRINVDYAGKAADYPYRFIAKGNSFISK